MRAPMVNTLNYRVVVEEEVPEEDVNHTPEPSQKEVAEHIVAEVLGEKTEDHVEHETKDKVEPPKSLNEVNAESITDHNRELNLNGAIRRDSDATINDARASHAGGFYGEYNPLPTEGPAIEKTEYLLHSSGRTVDHWNEGKQKDPNATEEEKENAAKYREIFNDTVGHPDHKLVEWGSEFRKSKAEEKEEFCRDLQERLDKVVAEDLDAIDLTKSEKVVGRDPLYHQYQSTGRQLTVEEAVAIRERIGQFSAEIYHESRDKEGRLDLDKEERKQLEQTIKDMASAADQLIVSARADNQAMSEGELTEHMLHRNDAQFRLVNLQGTLADFKLGERDFKTDDYADGATQFQKESANLTYPVGEQHQAHLAANPNYKGHFQDPKEIAAMHARVTEMKELVDNAQPYNLDDLEKRLLEERLAGLQWQTQALMEYHQKRGVHYERDKKEGIQEGYNQLVDNVKAEQAALTYLTAGDPRDLANFKERIRDEVEEYLDSDWVNGRASAYGNPLPEHMAEALAERLRENCKVLEAAATQAAAENPTDWDEAKEEIRDYLRDMIAAPPDGDPANAVMNWTGKESLKFADGVNPVEQSFADICRTIGISEKRRNSDGLQLIEDLFADPDANPEDLAGLNPTEQTEGQTQGPAQENTTGALEKPTWQMVWQAIWKPKKGVNYAEKYVRKDEKTEHQNDDRDTYEVGFFFSEEEMKRRQVEIEQAKQIAMRMKEQGLLNATQSKFALHALERYADSTAKCIEMYPTSGNEPKEYLTACYENMLDAHAMEWTFQGNSTYEKTKKQKEEEERQEAEASLQAA